MSYSELVNMLLEDGLTEAAAREIAGAEIGEED